MRGSPLLHALFLAIALALAGIPIWSLTRPHAHAVEAKAGIAKTGRHAVELAVTSTAPAQITLSSEGKVVWQSGAAATQFEQTLDLPVSGGELVAAVQWAGGQDHAARFQFSHDGETLADATLWGGAETAGVIPVPKP